MDTVIRLITDRTRILTIHFPLIHFQFGILLPNNSDKIVVKYLMELRRRISIGKWKDIFPIILFINGFKFNNPLDLEIDLLIIKPNIFLQVFNNFLHELQRNSLQNHMQDMSRELLLLLQYVHSYDIPKLFFLSL